MAKGSLFWGQSSGKLGQTVISNVNGQEVTRAYQPNVKNPKSYAQMLQRVKFANTVKFYKHASANFFRFAYEDKRKTESYYNAFMRHNTDVSMVITKLNYLNNAYPALGNQYQLTQGSIQPIEIVAPTDVAVEESEDLEKYWQIGLPVTDTKDSWGEISKSMVDNGYSNGDIITIVRVTSQLDDIDSEPSELPQWNIAQARIDIATANKFDQVWKTRGINGSSAIPDKVISGKLVMSAFDTDSSKELCGGLAVIVSRETSSGLKVSSSYLVNNTTARDVYFLSIQPDATNKALISWGAGEDEAILKGDIVNNAIV